MSQLMIDKSKQQEILTNSAQTLELDKVLAVIAGHALTPMAAEAIQALPVLREPDAINSQLRKTTDCRALLDRGERLPLEHFENCEPLLAFLKIEGRTLNAEQLVALARVARLARIVRRFCAEKRERLGPLWEIGRELAALKSFEQAIEKAIDFQTGEILDGASPELRRIRKSIETTRQKVRGSLQQTLKKAASKDMLQEQLVTMREGRLVIMVKGEFRRKINGIVHDQSATGQTAFVEPIETVELNNKVRTLEAEERAEIERILRNLSEQAREVRAELGQNYRILVELDMIQAQASWSQKYTCNAPIINDSGRVTLYAARHPLLLHKFDDQKKVVPLELQLGKDFSALIITGPNAGGKTVAMKTVGLAVLLARLGLHVPASADSEIGLMGNVFVDIGDQQSIENDLSTFTSHLQRLQSMVAESAAHDLVLIDEMGSGTDPEEGVALSIAMLNLLTQRKVRCIVTTHHGALKAYAHETQGAANGSMIFNTDSLEPTYRFQPNIPGSSYAFEIAARVGLNERLIAEARNLVGSEKGRVEALIADLQAKLHDQQALIDKLQSEELRLTGMMKLYRDRAEKLAENERKLKRQAIQDSEAIVAKANAAIEEAIREIREKQASKEAIKAAKRKVSEQKESLDRQRKKIVQPKPKKLLVDHAHPLILEPGAEAVWKKQNMRAQILEKPNGGKVHIQVGNMRLRVPVEELKGASKKTKRTNGAVNVSTSDKVLSHVDLRGKRVEEALIAVEQYLSDAMLSGWENVRLIHGRGTGALRKAILEMLKKHPDVEQYKLADTETGQGDAGVTEVKLK